MRKPNLFVVGAPKSATTSYYHYLSLHPDIFMSPFKEPHYFGSDLTGPKMTQFRGNLPKYMSLFKGVGDEKYMGEASNWLLFSSNAAAEIKAYNPDAKIIALMRSPVEMVYSMYYQFRYTGNETYDSFDDALAAEADRREGRNLPRMAHTLHGLRYTEIARYGEQVERYFDVFGREHVNAIIFDDLKKDAAGVYRSTLEFLGVDPEFQPEFAVVNANKQPRFWAMQQALMSVGISPMLLKDQLNYLSVTNPLFSKLNLVTLSMKAYTRYTKRPPMSLEARRHLNDAYRADIDHLGTLLGRDLSHWYAEPKPADSPVKLETSAAK